MSTRSKPQPFVFLFVFFALFSLGPIPTLPAASSTPPAHSAFEMQQDETGRTLVHWDPTALRAAAERGEAVRVEEFPLGQGKTAAVELEPFRVTSASTQFVIGSRHGDDRPLEFDPAQVQLFRGRVEGRPGSHVYLALMEDRTVGHVDPGAGMAPLRITSRNGDGDPFGPNSFSLEAIAPRSGTPPDVPLCGVAGHVEIDASWSGTTGEGGSLASSGIGPGVALPGTLHLQLAVETDYEFFVLFDNATDAAAYLVQLYGEVSAIYLRDTNMRVELVYARLWDNPDDLFNDVDPSPLPGFRNYWNSNMGHVARDATQLLSGRRDYPFGGQAYLSALCGPNAYSVVGYAQGAYPDPAVPSPFHFDIDVTAHELGHNSGTGHSHDAPNFVDTCGTVTGDPQRGTIMSYCGQTWSGGNMNRDRYFHTRIQQNIENYVGNASCITTDCNENGVPDDTDVQTTSADVNGNFVPDECEDCNGNSILDHIDLQTISMDANRNGIPDECEPDCNGNLLPDAEEIDDGLAPDLYGNGIPDECEADCNSNGTSDYTEIQSDIALDIDRNAVLDSCQNCDGDGTTDLEALDGAHDAWLASGLGGAVVNRFHALSGAKSASTAATIDGGQDVLAAPDGRFWVSSAGDDRVVEFDRDGTFLADRVPSGAGGLDYPTGLALTPDGRLLVASRDTDQVLAYDPEDGTFLGVLVAAGAGGLDAPFGLTVGPDGALHVASGTDEVLVYDAADGSYLSTLVDAADNGGLSQPRALVFKPDGNLLVASYGTDELLEFEGQTGEPLGKWAQVGTADRLTQISPWGVRVGPSGNVYMARTGEDYGSGASSEHDDHDDHGDDDEDGVLETDVLSAKIRHLHLTNAQIYEFDVQTGNFIRTYIGGNDHGHFFPTGFDFVPGWDVDCNFNRLPDACDIASGTSTDDDLSGIPDECEVDCNGNGVLDRLDIVPYGTERDCNGNLVPDACDIASETSYDCNTNGIPDECDITDPLEADTGWIVGAPGDDATQGAWERVVPQGAAGAPDRDRTPGGTLCFLTQQGADVDGGQTTLQTPLVDVSFDSEARIGYWRWFSNVAGANPGADVLEVDISDDGGQSWTSVETVGPGGIEASGGWYYHEVRVADFVTPTSEVRLRFVASDLGGDSIVEAAVDDLTVQAACQLCQPPLEVDSLRVDQVGGGTRLSWDDLGVDVVYDLVGDDLATLRSDGDVSAAGCLEEDFGPTQWDDPAVGPPPGQARYYLVRATTCAPGTYGADSSGAERQPAPACAD